MLKGNMLIAHGGGPTPVINSSLLGAVGEAKTHPEIETIYGARFGAEGILAGDFHAGDRLLLSEGEGGVVAAKAAP